MATWLSQEMSPYDMKHFSIITETTLKALEETRMVELRFQEGAYSYKR